MFFKSSKLKNRWSRRTKDPPEIDEPTIDQDKLAPGSSSAEDYGLVLLYDGAHPDHPDVDFVAVHGLGGHVLKTFTDAETGCCWLRDILPLNFPHCRVFSYGYPANIFANIPTSLSDQAKGLHWALTVDSRKQAIARRRIFICHSFGGLLVKRALIEASLDLRSVDVLKYASGILFFGTPHRGSSSADSALNLAKIIRVIPGLRRANQGLLREFRRNSSELNETNQMFNRVAAESMLIASFYETQFTKHVGIVTERSSAILDYPSEICISLDANHARLCKFKDGDDPSYKKVLNVIDIFCGIALLADGPLDASPASISISPSQENLFQWIPCVASKKGTTSMGLLEMAGSMEHPKDYSDTEMDIIAIHGLRGSPVRSWINRSPQTMWPRDMLQVDFPTSRVMSYGYRTEDVIGQNKFDLDILAKDLVDSIIDARTGFQNTAVRIILS